MHLPLVGLLMLLFITWKDFLVLFVIYDHDIKLITSFTVETITHWIPSHSLLTIAVCVHKDKGMAELSENLELLSANQTVSILLRKSPVGF